MKNIFYFISVAMVFGLLQSCVTQNHATTILRDPDNNCTVQVIMQIGVDGTQADVDAVEKDLQRCFSRDCVIPCTDGKPGCLIHNTVIVRQWSTIPVSDTGKFHHIKMVPQDKKPSFVNAVGVANGDAVGGTWRRDAYPGTYCHEVLHLCGLPDHYCSRIWDSVNHERIADVHCEGMADPRNDSCCDPTLPGTYGKRCSVPCPGHEHSIMATLDYGVSCENMLEVVQKAGFANCPDECCDKSRTAFDSTGGTPPFRVGGSVLFGYDDYFTRDDYNPSSVIKDNYPGIKIGVSLDADYHFTQELSIDARVKIIQFDGVTNHAADIDTFGSTIYENEYKSSYNFFSTGLEASICYEFFPNLMIFGGPSINFTFLTTTNYRGSTTTTTSGTSTTTEYGDKKFEKLPDGGALKNKVVSGGLNIGGKYDIKIADNMHIQPFIFTRLPFSSILKYTPAPKNYSNVMFDVNAGATLLIDLP